MAVLGLLRKQFPSLACPEGSEGNDDAIRYVAK